MHFREWDVREWGECERSGQGAPCLHACAEACTFAFCMRVHGHMRTSLAGWLEGLRTSLDKQTLCLPHLFTSPALNQTYFSRTRALWWIAIQYHSIKECFLRENTQNKCWFGYSVIWSLNWLCARPLKPLLLYLHEVQEWMSCRYRSRNPGDNAGLFGCGWSNTNWIGIIFQL